MTEYYMGFPKNFGKYGGGLCNQYNTYANSAIILL